MNLLIKSISVVEVHIFLHPVAPGLVLDYIFSVKDETEALQNVPGFYPGCSSKASDGGS
jgi:hypothetical protein